jgi:hypothetical protein
MPEITPSVESLYSCQLTSEKTGERMIQTGVDVMPAIWPCNSCGPQLSETNDSRFQFLRQTIIPLY